MRLTSPSAREHLSASGDTRSDPCGRHLRRRPCAPIRVEDSPVQGRTLSPVIHHVTLITGDGIGPEVCEAARRALEATGTTFVWDVQELGAESYALEGPPLLERAI